jgi:hypothetical protein
VRTRGLIGGLSLSAVVSLMILSPPSTAWCQLDPSCSTLATLSNQSQYTITASDVVRFPFMSQVFYGNYPNVCIQLDPITSAAGITCASSNQTPRSHLIFPIIGSVGSELCPTVNNPQQGYYYGRVLGADGLQYGNYSITVSVGYDPTSAPYVLAKQFQNNYAPYGASYNLYGINLETGPFPFPSGGNTWSNPAFEPQLVENVRQAAALARNAGFAGLAFNFERHDAWWDNDANVPNKGALMMQFGADLANAITSIFPNATVLEYPNCFLNDNPATITNLQRNTNGYWYYPEFCWTFTHHQFAQLALGDEDTYIAGPIVSTGPGGNMISQLQNDINYWPRDQAAGIAIGLIPGSFSYGEGLWPLGAPFRDATGHFVFTAHGLEEYEKTSRANWTPTRLQHYLTQINEVQPEPWPVTWVFDLGNSWELTLNDPWEPEPLNALDPQFAQFVAAIHAIKEQFSGAEVPTARLEPPVHHRWW